MIDPEVLKFLQNARIKVRTVEELKAQQLRIVNRIYALSSLVLPESVKVSAKASTSGISQSEFKSRQEHIQLMREDLREVATIVLDSSLEQRTEITLTIERASRTGVSAFSHGSSYPSDRELDDMVITNLQTLHRELIKQILWME